MKSSRRELKERAKEQLRGRWTTPVLITLIISIFSIVSSKISGSLVQNSAGSTLYSIISGLVTMVISVAVTALYLKLGRGNEVGFSDLLIEGKTIGKGICINLLTTLIYIPILLVAILIIALIMIFGFGESMYNLFVLSSISNIYSIIWLVLIFIVLLVVPLALFSLYFSLSIVFLCEDNNRGVWECIKLSFTHINGNFWRYFVLQLSFIGWGILSVLTFGIGFLWLTPYINTVNINFFNDVTGYDENNLNPKYKELEF